jgi:hypothetical protein
MPVTISGTNGVTFPDSSLQAAAASPYVLKNRIINGDMRIDQRNAGASVTPANGQYTLDRWTTGLTQTSKFTIQQNAGAVTPPSGFSNYLGITSSSAYSVVSGDEFEVIQNIEGFNTSDLDFGKATAKTITLSFWVRSSLTGTFGGSLFNFAQTRSYVFSYTISAANTWEQKTITIAGDTSGTWVGSTNSIGISVLFNIGAGSSRTTAAGVWNNAFNVAPTGQTSVVGTSGATFYITGVQLEQNTSATPFERRLYNQELANCQRYYFKTTNSNSAYVQFAIGRAFSGSAGSANLVLPCPMRTQPTLGYTTPVSGNFDYSITGLNISGWGSGSQSLSIGATGGSFLNGGAYALAAANVTSLVYLDFSAEL